MLGKHGSHHRSLGRALARGCAAVLACAAACAEAQASAAWFGSWDYVLKNDADGQPQAAFARLRGGDGAFLWLTCSKVALDEDLPPVASLTATVSQKQYLGRSDSRGRSTVYWFDDGGPEVGYWTYRDRYGQISNPEQVNAFVDRLTGAQSLVVELSNYRFETQKYEFQLSASETKGVADRFRKDCGAILAGQTTNSRLSLGADAPTLEQ